MPIYTTVSLKNVKLRPGPRNQSASLFLMSFLNKINSYEHIRFRVGTIINF